MDTPQRVAPPTGISTGEDLIVYFAGETQRWIFWFGVVQSVLLVAMIALLVAILLHIRRQRASHPGQAFPVIERQSKSH